MTRRTNAALLIVLSVSLAAALGPGARPALAQRGKWASPPYVPLSKKTPEAVTQLPSFGRIEWSVERIPWVAKGPGAGISGAGVVLHDGHIYVMGGFIPGGDETKDRDRRTSRWAYRYDLTATIWSPPERTTAKPIQPSEIDDATSSATDRTSASRRLEIQVIAAALEPIYGKDRDCPLFAPFPKVGHNIIPDMWHQAGEWIVRALAKPANPNTRWITRY